MGADYTAFGITAQNSKIGGNSYEWYCSGACNKR